jgi:hypothetical protein
MRVRGSLFCEFQHLHIAPPFNRDFVGSDQAEQLIARWRDEDAYIAAIVTSYALNLI